MRYMILIYNDPSIYATMSQAQGEAEFRAYMAFNAEAQKRGVMREGVQLHPVTTATTVRVRDGKTMTVDGPFAETKEVLGGVYILDCKDLDEATALAAMIPGALNGSIELRPFVEF